MSKDSLKRMPSLIKMSLRKARKLVSHFSKSTLSRQLLSTIQDELDQPRKFIIVGTQNRWFHKMAEAERLVELRMCVEEFQMRRLPGEGRRAAESDDEECAALTVPDQLDDEDFERLHSYVKAVRPFTALSKFLGGEKYPTAGCVIPALDQIKEDLEKLKSKMEDDEEAGKLIEHVLSNMAKRFKGGLKKKNPFNCLTFLDPRYVDLYAYEEDAFQKIVEDISRCFYIIKTRIF